MPSLKVSTPIFGRPNSGRLLWMTQPPYGSSSSWQILSSDYDTQASFYGVKKACEPVHVQLDLSSYETDVVNTTQEALQDVSSEREGVFAAEQIAASRTPKNCRVGANALTPGFKLELAPFLSAGMVFVKLALTDSAAKVVSDNLYWLGGNESPYRPLNRLPPASVVAGATATRDGDEIRVHVQLENRGTGAALANKLTLENSSDGARILPAYLSDNYVSLLPGETRAIEIQYPAAAAQGSARIEIRGWNLSTMTVPVPAP